jgi:ribonuclease Z
LSFSVKILGSNSATPAHNRHHSAQFLSLNNEHYLIDCGEGTQLQLIRYRTRFHKISHIFISHLHGDHYLGLMGLLLTMHLQRREQPLTIFGPAGLDEIITIQLRHSGTSLFFPLEFIAVPSGEWKHQLLDTPLLSVYSFPLDHRSPCTGFLFSEKPHDRRFRKEMLNDRMTSQQIAQLKQGKDVIAESGKIMYRWQDYTLPPKPPRSYAYCSDTRYLPNLVDIVRNADLLYHEATFLHDQQQRAYETGHSTATQAAMLARDAQVGKLVLGHFSVRYRDLSPFRDEARQVFSNTDLAVEGETINIGE